MQFLPTPPFSFPANSIYSDVCHCRTLPINFIIYKSCLSKFGVTIVVVMDTDPVLRCQVQQVVREAQNKLNTSDDANEIQLTLQGMTSLLPGGKFQRTLAGIPGDKLCEASRVFMDRHYVMFVECLLGRLTADWTGVVLKGQTEALFDAFFLQGAPVDSFIVLCAAITGSRLVSSCS